jgi:hypothetical protein
VTAPTPVPVAEMAFPGKEADTVPVGLFDDPPADCVEPAGGAGGCGPEAGVTAAEGADAGPVPWELAAVTVKV